MKEFWKELEPTLTKDQLARLKEMEQRRMEMWRQNQKGRVDSVNFRDRGRRGMSPPPGGRRIPDHERPDSNRL